MDSRELTLEELEKKKKKEERVWAPIFVYLFFCHKFIIFPDSEYNKFLFG